MENSYKSTGVSSPTRTEQCLSFPFRVYRELSKGSSSSFFKSVMLTLVILVAGIGGVWGQAATATWALTSNATVSTSGDITATSESLGAGVTSVAFTPTNGHDVTACGGGVCTPNSNDFYQFTLTPNCGSNMSVTSITFTAKVNNGTRCLKLFQSVDGAAETQIGANFSTTTTTTNFTTGTLNIGVTQGKIIRLRLYVGNDTDGRNTFLKNFVVNTTTTTVSQFTPSVSILSNDADNTFCSGTNVTFTASASNTGGATVAYQWKVNGGNVGLGGTTYSSTSLANNDQVSCSISISGGSCLTGTTANSSSITNTVNSTPTITGNTPASRCGTGTVTLGATASAGTVNWYSASSGGSSLQSGTSFTTPSISSTTTYYVDATSGGCTTASRTAVAATVNSVPVAATLSSPTNAATGVSTSPTLSWGAVSGATSYDVYLGTTSPGVFVSNVATTSFSPASALNSTTTYYWYIVAKNTCGDATASSTRSFTTVVGPATLPLSENFNSSNNFTFVNGSQTNPWVYGSAVGNTGSSIFISSDGGTSNTYNVDVTSVAHAYREITIPSGASTGEFSFDWRANGESTYDYLRVWLVPSSFTPAAGTQISSGSGRIQVGTNFNQVSTWQTYSNTSLDLSSFANSTMRLVFEWRNDGSVGTLPPGAIDNVSLIVPTCLLPTSLTSSNLTTTTATVGWNAASPAPSNGYEYAVTTSITPPASVTATSNLSEAVTGLSASTTYYLHVRSYCGGSDYSSWVTSTAFITPCSATNVPYTLDFESVSAGSIPSCTQVEQGGTGNLWNTASNPGYGFTSMTLQYEYNIDFGANTWYFLQGLNLTGGVSYRLTYRYGSSGLFPENLKVAYGTSNTIGAMTNSLADHPNITTTNQSNTIDFTPSSTGVYFIGFHAYSAANEFLLLVDDISVTVTPAACATPSAQPTSLTLTPTSGTTVDGSFTASASADNYLVIRKATSSAPTNPTNGTSYTAGSSALGGTIVASGASTTFSDAGLSTNTQYWYWVYAFNADNCSAGPAYLTTSPLSGNTTTPNVKTWIGYGTATGTSSMTDFNASANWSPAGAPSSSDNLVINFTDNNDVTISLTASATVNSLTITDALNSNPFKTRTLAIGDNALSINGNFSFTNSAIDRAAVDVVTIASSGSLTIGGNLTLLNTNSSNRANRIIFQNSGTMTVNGSTLMNSKNASTGSFVEIRIGSSPAICTFNGNVTLDDGTSVGNSSAYAGLGGIASGNTGSFVFKNNLTIGAFGATATNAESLSFLFDGTTGQTITDNGLYWYFIPGNITVGSSNNPTVTITAGSSSGLIFPQNNITLNGSSTLVIKSGETLNNWLGAGALTLNGTSTLKLEGTTGGQTGSNFPTGFSSYSLASGSTVEYNGGAQTVFATPTYGNLAISTSGTKTAGGNLTVVGNTTVNSPATLAMSSFTQNLSGNFINNGVFSEGTGTVNFTGSAATQTISGTGALNFSNVSINKSAGEVSLSNNISVSGALTFNSGNLNLNGKTLNYSGGTISTNSGIIGSTTSSKLKFTASSQIPSNLFQSDIYDLEISGVNTNVTSDAEFTIANDLIVGSQSTFTLSAGFAVTMKGNITNNGTINGLGTSSELIFDKDGSQTVTGAALSVGSMTIDKLSGNLTLYAPLQVKGTLTMTKGDIVTTSANILEVGSASNPGSVSWTAGTVRGPMKRWFGTSADASQASGIFPVGVQSGAKAGTNRYAQVNFSSNPGSGGYIVAEYKTGAPSQVPTGLPLNYSSGSYPQAIQNFEEEGYWDITPYNADGQAYQALNSTPYTLKLRLQNPSTLTTGWSPSNDGNDLYNASTIRMIRAKGSNNHANWELAGTHVSATETGNGDYFITSSGITEFSWFNGGGNNQNPLPVELLSFNGTCNEGMVDLLWQTASEFNSSHFDVEKSTDGETWRVLATIPSAGISNELLTYQTVDNNGTSGSNYYRLRQVDIDGKEKLYDPINVSCAETTAGYFTSYPNPSGSEFQVIVNNKEILGACTLNIVDVHGKVIDQRKIEVKDGINMFVISEKLTPGIYFLNITNGTKTTQVIKHAVK